MGTIATFYSFKGGVGRTMALANIAALLCKHGKRVLAVDWDLEAPGLDKYFAEYPIEKSKNGGLLELLIDAQTKPACPDWREFVSQVNLRAPQKLSLIACNTDNKEYVNLLSDFSWSAFFEEHGGGAFIESLRDDWKSEYDVTLLDSRTGLTDAGGVCTIQLPDILVAVFSANNQSFHGVIDIIKKAQAGRQRLAYDRMPLTILPLPSRFDSRTEFEESQAWLDRFAEELADFYKDWLPSGYTPRQALERTKIPHVAFFSFGEKLPVLTHGVSDPDSIGFAFDMAAELIESDFQRFGKLLGRTPPTIDAQEPPEPCDVFISYAHKDRPAAKELAERLRKDGLRVWFDEWAIRPGDSILLAIETGLENSRTLVFMMSSNTVGSEWVILERQTALFRDTANRERRFIPLRLDDAPLPDSLKAYAYVDWRNKDPNEYQRLLVACGGQEAETIAPVPRAAREREDPQIARFAIAKVLIVGDSGVGKSGLSIRLTENQFKATVSTDGHWATQLKLPHESVDANNPMDREIWLWDFAGQSDYRLIHQLFMDETALVVLVFNPQSENPFEGLRQWDRGLARAARRAFAKLLVAGRCDRGRLRVSKEAALGFAGRQGFAEYLETSALTGEGCDQLRAAIVRHIDWDKIPWTTSPRIFKILKDEILRLRDAGVVLLRLGELRQQLGIRLVEEETFTLAELETVVGLLATSGLVQRLAFGGIIMLQPEWINKYAAAVIRSIRDKIGEIGVIDERQVLSGDLDYTLDIARTGADGEKEQTIKVEMQRLGPAEEAIVLRAMHQLFVDRGLCVREALEGGGRQLVFPSYFKQELPTDPGHPPVLARYRFDGDPEEVYATLITQLWQTRAFENGELWRNAADFKSAAGGARLGLKMTRHEDGAPEISVYFDSKVQDDTRVTFIKYVHEHLLRRARAVTRLREFVCPHCGHPVRDTELARDILEEEGKEAAIRCQQPECDKRFPLWDVIEQKFASPEFQQRVRELEEKAKAAMDNESRELILEGHARAITGEAGQIYRGYIDSDHGIDGEIEFKNDAGQASGQRLYLQLKSGDSYLTEQKSDGKEIFQIKKARWADYWRNQAYPVMLVIRASDGAIRWMNVTEYLEEKGGEREGPVRQIVFDGEPFTALNLQRMRARV